MCSRPVTCLMLALLWTLPVGSIAAPAPAADELAADSVRAAKWAQRDGWQMPDSIFEYLRIRPGMVVADLGAGDGYFTHLLARAVGPSGRVLALDVDRKALDANMRIVAREGLTNVESRVIPKDAPGLTPGEADLVFICKTWHFLPDRLCYARRLAALLKRGARVAVINSGQEPGTIASRAPGTTDRYEVRREAESAGMRLVAQHRIYLHQFLVELELGRADIFDLIPGFRYVTAELAVGGAPPDSPSIAALRSRGFFQVLDLREAPDSALEARTVAGGLHYARVDRVTLASAAADPKLGVSLLVDTSGARAAEVVRAVSQAGGIHLSACEDSLLRKE
jgi:predicted methyltransferase/rhodanese-related sulfurtransferase